MPRFLPNLAVTARVRAQARCMVVALSLPLLFSPARGDGNHTVYLDSNGSLHAMGDNTYGQLGDGTTTDRNVTTRIVTSGVTAVAQGVNHTLFVKADGSLWVTGRNESGQLGDGTTTDVSTPKQVVSSGVTSVAAGELHSLFLMEDGSLWAMGLNSRGQLGDGTGLQRTTPKEVLGSNVVAIAAGRKHSLFLKNNGSLWAMGLNEYGQLGDGFSADRLSPVQVVTSGVVAIAAGESHSLYVKSDGSVWAMGRNANGEFGNGSKTQSLSPTQVLASGGVAVAAGYEHSLILDVNGSVRSAGSNTYGQLGDGTSTEQTTFVKPVASGVAAIAANWRHSLYRTSSGALHLSGANGKGQLGQGNTTQLNSFTQVTSAVEVERLAEPRAIHGQGAGFSLYMKSDALWGMGQNDNGELGLMGPEDRNASVEIVSSGVTGFAVGSDYALYVKNDGSLLAMGLNAHGQFGDGTRKDRLTPSAVLSSGVVDAAASRSNRFSLFLKTDGTLWGMGLNANGELGLGHANETLTPTQISANVVTFAAGYDHAYFVKSDGSLWAMGANTYGQLGDGTTTSRSSPVQIQTADVEAVAAGNGHGLFRKSDGAVCAMGRNDYGQLGDGSNVNRSSPVELFGEGASDVAAGANHSLFLKNGALWVTGRNDSGQLGTGDYVNRNLPVKAVGTGVDEISAGHAHTLMRKSGALYAAGLNLDGQLGLSDKTNRSGFYQVLSSGVTELAGPKRQGGSPPAFQTFSGSLTLSENGLSFGEFNATDAEGKSVTYAFNGGSDDALFDLNVTTGAFSFKVYPDFEHPHDSDLNNSYQVIVRASDGNRTTDKTYAFTVSDANASTSVVPSPETAYAFTSAGATGAQGPSQAQVDANYTGSTLASAVTVTGQGVQEWKVPYKALYRIEVVGAAGGSLSGQEYGGLGARSIGVFDLNVSTLLKVVVGQRGGDANGTGGGAGGGGSSFVTYADGTPLVVAGGGGGAGAGQTAQDGNASSTTIPGSWRSAAAVTSTMGGSANGGGGWAGSGVTANVGGQILSTNAQGGTSASSVDGSGGYGGGAAAESGYGGGGGGYTGGIGGNDSNATKLGGQGGGSYASASSSFLAGGYRKGDGLVIVTLVSSLNALPTDIDLNNTKVTENVAAGAVIGDFNATDADTNATHAFTLVDGNGSTHNSLFSISGRTLTLNVVPDYETNATLNVRVRVTDDHNATYEEAFSIAVQDLDDQVPVITLGGDANVTHEAASTYTDAGATWTDNVDGTGSLTATGTVNGSVPGTYLLTYSKTDAAGNAAATLTRTVVVKDTTAPAITLTGDANVTHEAGPAYADANATWTDALDGNGTLTPVGEVNATKPGTYELTFDKTDAAGNVAATVKRTVIVKDTTAPVITLNGDANVTHEAPAAYVELNATWTDAVDGNGTIVPLGSVNVNAPGTYILSFSKQDAAGNAATILNRIVTVVDTTAPVVTLSGDANVTMEATNDSTYSDAGATWSDTLDGNGTLIGVGEVKLKTPGVYSLLFTKKDVAGNTTSKTRTVTVKDTISPVITLEGNATYRHRVFQTFVDPGAKGVDGLDGNLTVSVSGDVNASKPGTYVRSYSVSDAAGNAAAVVTRSVVVFNDAPTDLNRTSVAVEENHAAGQPAGVFSTTDPDDANSTRTYVYTLVSGEGSADNDKFLLEANGSLRSNATFDFETNATHSIRVRTTDEFNATFEKAVTIQVQDAFAPGLTTNPASGVTMTAATLSGDVMDAGHGLGVTARGFALSTSPDPALGGSGVTVLNAGSGSGSFTAEATGLTAGKRYYFRPYATNAEGTGYGTLEWFDANTTSPLSTPTWSGASAVTGAPSWWSSPWFGSFAVTTGTDWIRHERLGWLYVVHDVTDGIWFWHDRLGWFWTSDTLYPYLYLQSGAWHYYSGEADGRLFLYRYSDGTWRDFEANGSN